MFPKRFLQLCEIHAAPFFSFRKRKKTMYIGKIDSFGIFDMSTLFKAIKTTHCRRVEMFEFEYIVSDEGVTFIDGKKYKLFPNTFILRKPGQTSYSTVPFKCYYFHMEVNPDCEYGQLLKSLPDFLYFIDGNACRSIMESLIMHLTNNGADPYCYYTNARLLELFYLLKNNDKKRSASDARLFNAEHLEPVKKAVSYIKTHYEEPVSLQSIAAVTGYSPNYFHGIFTSVTGTTPQQYLNNERLKNAKRMLATTQKSLLDISTECGFSSQSYFTEQFKKATLLTPHEYRKTLMMQYSAPFKDNA